MALKVNVLEETPKQKSTENIDPITIKELDPFLRQFLYEEGKKFLRYKDGKIFVFNPESRIFIPLPVNSNRALTLITLSMARRLGKYFEEEQSDIFRRIRKTRASDRYFWNKIHTSLYKKIIFNPSLYCPLFDFTYGKVSVPLRNQKSLKIENKSGIIYKTSKSENLFFHLNVDAQDYELLDYLRGYESCMYFQFLQELSTKNGRIMDQTISLIRDCILNSPCEKNAIYVVVYDGNSKPSNLLDLYLQPILNLFPDEYRGFMSSLSQSRYKFDAMLVKRVNFINGNDFDYSPKSDKRNKSNQKFVKNYILDGKYYTDTDGKNYQNTTLHIIAVSKDNLSKVECILPENFHYRLKYILLPSEISQKWGEPDCLEFILDEPFALINLAAAKTKYAEDENITSDNDVKEITKVELCNSLDEFENFFDEYLEVTGNLNEILVKKDVFNRYLRVCYPEEYLSSDEQVKSELSRKHSGIFGKKMKSRKEFKNATTLTEFNNLRNSISLFFAETKIDSNTCWRGLKFKK